MLLRRGHLLLILPVFILLQACGSAGLKDYYAAHGADFEARTGYISHRITRGDFMLEAREFGEAGDQPTLILMHGFPDSMRLYDWLVPELMSDRHIIAFDFLGWGDSDKPRDHLYNVASLRADLEAVLAAFELDSVVLVVHDASGQPGIDWALDNPEKKPRVWCC